MRKAAIIILSLVCLVGCKLHDDYTGEPFLHMEYTLDGEHHVYEDWGHVLSGFFRNSFGAVSRGDGLGLLTLDVNESIACFDLGTEKLGLYVESNKPFFIDGKRYDYYHREGTKVCYYLESQRVVLTEGWYSFTRHTVEPYCSFDFRFEFHGSDSDGMPVDVTEGIIQVGRRFQRGDISGLVKKEAEL